MTTAISSSLSILAGDYTLDPARTRLGFVARLAKVVEVRGAFHAFVGLAHIDEDPSRSWVKLTMKVDSLDTGSAERDEQLRTNDFFDIAHHPTITFESTGVRQRDELTVEVVGDLTVKDITREVAIPFELLDASTDIYGLERLRFEGSVVVNRKDWGLSWNAALEVGTALLGDEVRLEFEVSAVRTA